MNAKYFIDQNECPNCGDQLDLIDLYYAEMRSPVLKPKAIVVLKGCVECHQVFWS